MVMLKGLKTKPNNMPPATLATLKTNNSKTVMTGFAAIILIAILFFYFSPSSQAQTRQNFTLSDEFNISQLNGTIRFASNGSFSSATLENDTWVFNDLRFNISRPLGNLKISAENSNMTIFSYQPINFFGRSFFLMYSVDGVGRQTVNLGLNVSQPTSASEWSVITPGSVFLAEGEGWKLLTDDTVVLTGLTGNLSIVHYNFGEYNDENLPFNEKHSVAIIIAIVLASTVTVGVVIKFRGRD
jgi:hypothetical protein